MAEYIKREDVEKALLERCKETGYGGLTPDDIRLVMRTPWRIPAADVRPVVRGKWEKGTGENGVTTSLFCSVCHYENTHWREWNYCPNCGARMEES